MIVSFDLDGVISDTDSPVLAVLHQAILDKVPNATARLYRYYASRRLLLNPYDWLAEGDEGVIITGRFHEVHELTIRWVRKNCGNISIYFASTPETEALYQAEEYEEASRVLAESKLRLIVQQGAALHIDNNPIIVHRLRLRGVPALQYGGTVEVGDA